MGLDPGSPGPYPRLKAAPNHWAIGTARPMDFISDFQPSIPGVPQLKSLEGSLPAPSLGIELHLQLKGSEGPAESAPLYIPKALGTQASLRQQCCHLVDLCSSGEKTLLAILDII